MPVPVVLFAGGVAASVPVAGAVVVSVPVAGAVVVLLLPDSVVVAVPVPVAGAVVVLPDSVVVPVPVPVAGAVVVVSLLFGLVAVVVVRVLKYQIAAMTRIAMIAAATQPIGELSPRGGRGLILLFTEFAIVSVSR